MANYKAEFGQIKLEGDLQYIIETMYGEYGKSLRQIGEVVDLSPQGVLDKINIYGVEKGNKVLEDKNIFLMTDAEIIDIYDIPPFTIKQARATLDMAVRDCCSQHISIGRRRQNLINNLFGGNYNEGKNFIPIFCELLDELELLKKYPITPQSKELLINFYVNPLKFDKNKRPRKSKLVKKIKKHVNKKAVNYWLKLKFIKENK